MKALILLLALLSARPAGAGPPSAPAAAPSTDPIVMTGDAATFDIQHGLYEITGHAEARRAESVLNSERILYQHQRRFLQASGQVRFVDPRATVTAGVLDYDIGTEWLTTRQDPVARVHSTDRMGETTLSALTITFDRARERLLAEGNVRTRVIASGNKIYDIQSESLESFMKEQRNVFKGKVKIASREMGAQGDRAIFYEKTEKLNIIGNAKAWRIEPNGTVGRVVEGRQILHDSRTGRSVALEGVTLKDRLPGPSSAGGKPKQKTLKFRTGP